MEQYTRYIGFDVSAEPIVIAEALPGRERARDLGTIPYRLDSVSQWIRRQPDAASLLICYEAGPTGFGLARPLHRLGGACEVIAPGLIPHQVDVSLFPLQWKIYFHRPPKFYAGE
jgi:hypothetical protein